MQYTTEFDVSTFEFWSGARDTAEEWRKKGRLAELGELIESAFEGLPTPPSETDINDFVWFDEAPGRIWEEDEEEEEEE